MISMDIHFHGQQWKSLAAEHLGVKPLRTALYKVDKMLDTLSANSLPTEVPSVDVIAKEINRNVSINYTFQSNLVDHVVAQAIQEVPDPTQLPPVPNT